MPAAGGGGGGRAVAGGRAAAPAVPYWGKYVYHDNNRDINLSQMSMRALADWYFTAHPPIMHDLHESLPLLYTYSGAAPQNPNLDPILFAELPLFSNFELAQMTKWGMPGVYTHAFMDGWSPGYLGSVAYNHNGMMRMYETQSGREAVPARRGAAVRRRRASCDGEGGRGAAQAGRGAGAARAAARRDGVPAVAAAAAAADRTRRRAAARVVSRHSDSARAPRNNFSRRNNTNYMQTGVLSGAAAHGDVPEPGARELLHARRRTRSRRARPSRRTGSSFPVQRDMTRVAELVNILRMQRIEVGPADERDQAERRHVPGRLVRHQARPAVRPARQEPAREAELSRSRTSAPTTTAAGRWAWRCWWTSRRSRTRRSSTRRRRR